jgi:hypothetical protein
MEEVKEKVFIIGSIKQARTIKLVAETYNIAGYDVKYVEPYQDVDMNTLIDKTLIYINEADIVAVVTKPDGSFGDGTSYAMAFARFLEKEILIHEHVECYDDEDFNEAWEE